MVDYNQSSVWIQPSAYRYDSGLLIEPIAEFNHVDKMFPNITGIDIADLQFRYHKFIQMSLPEYKMDLERPKINELESQEFNVDIPEIQDSLTWTGLQWRRVARDIMSVNERVRELAVKFGDKRDRIGIAGSTNPFVPPLLGTTRATDAALTNKDATLFTGWTAMISELKSDLRSNMKQEFLNALAQGRVWIACTSDIYQLAEQTFSTIDDTKNALSWVTTPINQGGAGIPTVLETDHLGATLTNNESNEDGAANIMMGIHSMQTAALIQTNVERFVNEEKDTLVDWWFSQRFRPVTFNAVGFHYDDGVTVT